MVRDFDLELDRAIDALADNNPVATIPADEGLGMLLETVTRLRALPAEHWPDPDFADRLVPVVSDAVLTKRRDRTRRRAWASMAVAGPIAAAVALVLALVPFGTGQAVSAQTLAHRAASVSAGLGLGPVRFTEVVTSHPAVFEPTPPPSKVTETVTFASPSRWRVDAVINEANGVDHRTTIRNGNTIAAATVNAAGVRSASTITTQAGPEPDLPAAGEYGMIADPGRLLAASAGAGPNCVRPITVDNSGPSVDGRRTRLLDVGPDPCPSASIPETAGPATFAVDQESSLVLQSRIYSAGGSLLEEAVVTQLAFGGTFASDLFALPSAGPSAEPAPPAGPASPATLDGPDQLQAALGHRPLLPANLPSGLKRGRIEPVATDPASGRLTAFTVTYNGPDGTPALQLYEAPAASESVRFPGRNVAIRPGQPGVLNTSPEMTILWWIQDRTYISLQQGGQSAGVALAGSLSQSQLMALAAQVR